MPQVDSKNENSRKLEQYWVADPQSVPQNQFLYKFSMLSPKTQQKLSKTTHKRFRWFVFMCLLLPVSYRLATNTYECLRLIHLASVYVKFSASFEEISESDQDGLLQKNKNTDLSSERIQDQSGMDEHKFWKESMKATLLSLFASIFPFLGIPVYWQFLVIYFILLLGCSIYQSRKDIKKYFRKRKVSVI